MPDALPNKYTCLNCYTVAILPCDTDILIARCPNCSPTTGVEYQRGIVLKPGSVQAAAGVVPSPAQTTIVKPSISLQSAPVEDTAKIDALTARIAELEQENAKLQSEVAAKTVRVPAPPVAAPGGLSPSDAISAALNAPKQEA